MSGAHSRRKQPEAVRRALLDSTASIAAREGLAAVTIDSVAKAAGVTKGGLFHHFPSKQALLEGAFAQMLSEVSEAIDVRMAADPDPKGRFTRAYVESIFDDIELAADSQWAALAVALLADAGIRKMWSAWFSVQLERYAGTDDSVDHAVARLAADGAWYACVLGVDGGFEGRIDELKARLLSLTQS